MTTTQKMPPIPTPTGMEEGPAVQPARPLLEWLIKKATTPTGKRQLFRLPVVIQFTQGRLAIAAAFVGVSEQALGNPPLALALDTTGMSQSPLTILRARCPKTETSCAVWLDGYWGNLLQTGEAALESSTGDASDGKKWPFTVLRIHELISPTEAPAHALLETTP